MDRLAAKQTDGLSSHGAEVVLLRADRSKEVVVVEAKHGGLMGEYQAPQALCLNLCLSGGGKLALNSHVQRIEAHCLPGSIGVTPAGEAGRGGWSAMRVLHVGVGSGRLRTFAEEAGPEEVDIEAAASRLQHSPIAAAALQALKSEASGGRLGSAYADHLLAVALHALLRRDPDRVERSKMPVLSPAILRRVRDKIDASLGEDISVTELAAIAGLTRWHFSRAFQASTGLPPYAYIKSLRLDHAAQLLRDPALSVTEIAVLLGYANPSRFAAAFRERWGLSPSEWRRHLS